MMDTTIGLRIDIDFEIGLVRGVPYLLDVLKQEKIAATFFVTMGPDGFKHNMKRLRSKNYVQRILSFNPWKIISTFGVSYLLKQFSGQSGNVGADHSELLTRILNEGHELGVHGYDHFWWAGHVWNCDRNAVKEDMTRGIHAFEQAVGNYPKVWASPNWRCSKDSLQLVDEFGFQYGADCRGTSPFYPVIGEWQANTLQIPITLPCLHEIVQHLQTKDHETIVKHLLSTMTYDRNIWCIHGYYEGVLERVLFRKCVQAIKSRQVTWMTLHEYYTGLDKHTAPECPMTKARLPGGRGEISFQGTNS